MIKRTWLVESIWVECLVGITHAAVSADTVISSHINPLHSRSATFLWWISFHWRSSRASITPFITQSKGIFIHHFLLIPLVVKYQTYALSVITLFCIWNKTEQIYLITLHLTLEKGQWKQTYAVITLFWIEPSKYFNWNKGQ